MSDKKPKRDIEAELKEMAVDLIRRNMDIAVGISCMADDDADLSKLTARQRNAAKFARLPRSEAPVGLELAYKFLTNTLPKLISPPPEQPKGHTTNILVGAPPAVQLPARDVVEERPIKVITDGGPEGDE